MINLESNMALSRSSSTTYLRLCILSALGVFAISATAATADSSTIDNNELTQVELDKIVVTATRIPTKTSNVIAQTRVVDSEALKRYQGQTALDVIKNQPGFNYKQNGGLGTVGSFYTRGYDSKQILVLIDGIRYSSISTGEPALSLLPADQIDRIEILYGASGSSIYGADAMGGVIQIFTKGSNIEQSQLSVTVGAGSHDQFLYGATAQFINDQGTSLSISASHNETDGINATLPTHPWGIHNLDEDGFKINNYSLHLSQKINPDLKVGVSGLYSESTTDFDSGKTTEKDFTKAEQKNGAAQAFIDWNYSPTSSVKLSYGHSIDESQTTATTYTSFYDTTQKQVSLVGSHSISTDKLLYGIEHLKQEIDTSAYPEADNREVTSGFLGYMLSRDKIDAQANVRHDDYSEYDSETTYNLGTAYRLTSDLRVGVNYAKGYRVPTFNDLFDWGGDPNLKPETSDNYEAFIEYDTLLQSTRLTGYRNEVEDMIASDANYQRKNYAEAKIEGVILTSDWFFDNYLFGLSYDYQEAKDDSGKDNDGNYLPTRPKHKGTVYVGYQLSDLDIRAEYQYVDDYYSNIENTSKIDNYNIINISGNYQLSSNLSMSARLNNVFNEKYLTEPGYNTDGTNFLTSLTYTWK
jgi:vitamin B12 transporter